MKKIKHGEKIIINNKLIRTEIYNDETYKKDYYKKWQKQPIEEREVIFLGYRTLFNGVSKWDNDGIYFIPKEKIKVGLVSENSRLNPYYTNLD